jgi:hypothetical protein
MSEKNIFTFEEAKELISLLIDKPVDEALELIESWGGIPCVSRMDGVRFILTQEFRPNRVNLEIDDDIVTKASLG